MNSRSSVREAGKSRSKISEEKSLTRTIGFAAGEAQVSSSQAFTSLSDAYYIWLKSQGQRTA